MWGFTVENSILIWVRFHLLGFKSPLLFSSGSLVGSGHSGQGERWPCSDWCCRGRRWKELTRADESHDSGAWPKNGAPEGGHPWWQPWSGAENQHQTLPVRTLYCSMTSLPQHGTIYYFCSFHKTMHFFFYCFSLQCFWKQWESSSSRSGHTASNTRPSQLLCNWLLSFKHVPHSPWYRKSVLSHCSLFILLLLSGLLHFGPGRL